MKTLMEVVLLSTEYLLKKGVSNARREAEYLIGDALNLKRLDLYMEFERPVNEEELTLCRENLKRRGLKEPLQYIKGFVEFYDCKIKVSKDVLIPRQETEILVDKIAKRLQEDLVKFGSLKGKILFDLCTGSGCIAIALKKKFPDLTVIASDISLKAITIARENAAENQVDIEFLIGNLLDPLIGKKCHYFVSNPPYIAENEYAGLEDEVRGFEPKIALVSGNTGLECYKKFADELPGFLHNRAALFLEIGHAQKNDILNLFIDSPWTNCLIEKDWSSNDRFFFLEIE